MQSHGMRGCLSHTHSLRPSLPHNGRFPTNPRFPRCRQTAERLVLKTRPQGTMRPNSSASYGVGSAGDGNARIVTRPSRKESTWSDISDLIRRKGRLPVTFALKAMGAGMLFIHRCLFDGLSQLTFIVTLSYDTREHMTAWEVAAL